MRFRASSFARMRWLAAWTSATSSATARGCCSATPREAGSAGRRSPSCWCRPPRTTTSSAPTLSLTTLNYWSVGLTYNRFFRAYDDRLTRGGPMALRPAWNDYILSVHSDPRLPVGTSAFVFYEQTEKDGWTQHGGVSANFKSSTWWNLSVGPFLTRQRIPAQYLTSVPDASYTPTYGVRYVFAPLDYEEVGIETRLNMTFTPKLSFESYIQPLLSSGAFRETQQLVAPRTYDFTPYDIGTGGSGAPFNFNLRQLRGNAVLRWEWREGSTLYVAWQQSRFGFAPFGDFAFGREATGLRSTRPDNIFVVKVNYWLNP